VKFGAGFLGHLSRNVDQHRLIAAARLMHVPAVLPAEEL